MYDVVCGRMKQMAPIEATPIIIMSLFVRMFLHVSQPETKAGGTRYRKKEVAKHFTKTKTENIYENDLLR